MKKRWHNWKAELSKLTKISIPRWFHSSKENAILHDSTNVSFVIGKSRIAPIGSKSLTIPKLELQAAVLAVRLKEAVLQSVDVLIMSKICFWTDSQIVLQNITNQNHKFPVYMMNRLNEIRHQISTVGGLFLES